MLFVMNFFDITLSPSFASGHADRHLDEVAKALDATQHTDVVLPNFGSPLMHDRYMEKIEKSLAVTEHLPWLREHWPQSDWKILMRILKVPETMEYRFRYLLMTTSNDLATMFKLTFHENGMAPFRETHVVDFDAYARMSRQW